MPVPEPPTSGTISDWVSWILLMLGVALAYVAFNWLGGRLKRDANGEDSHLTIPTRNGDPSVDVDVRGMSPAVVSALASVSTTLTSVMEDGEDLKSRVAALEADNQLLTKERSDLVAEIAALRQGVLDGTIPPLPELAAAIEHLFVHDIR